MVQNSVQTAWSEMQARRDSLLAVEHVMRPAIAKSIMLLCSGWPEASFIKQLGGMTVDGIVYEYERPIQIGDGRILTLSDGQEEVFILYTAGSGTPPPMREQSFFRSFTRWKYEVFGPSKETVETFVFTLEMCNSFPPDTFW